MQYDLNERWTAVFSNPLHRLQCKLIIRYHFWSFSTLNQISILIFLNLYLTSLFYITKINIHFSHWNRGKMLEVANRVSILLVVFIIYWLNQVINRMSMSSVCHEYVISRQLNIPSTDMEAVTSLIGTLLIFLNLYLTSLFYITKINIHFSHWNRGKMLRTPASFTGSEVISNN
jgi:hypothetical protein